MSTPSPRLAIFLIVFLDVMGFGLIIPSQPFLAKHFGASPATVTLLGTTYSLMQFLLAPVWGTLSDRFGRRPILLFTITMTMLGHATFAASSSLLMLFVARGLAGSGAANIATAQAVLADTHGANERSRAMALIGAAFGIGFIFGPAIGGVLFQWDHRAPAAFGAILALTNLIFVAAVLPETRSSQASQPHRGAKISDLRTLDSKLKQLVLTTLLFITAFALMEQSVGLFIERHWINPDSSDPMARATTLTSMFLVVVGITATLVQGFLVRSWLKTRSEVTLFRAGLMTIALSLVAIPIFGALGSFSLFLISGATLALGSGLFNPSMAGLVSLASPPERQGFGLAINQSAAALGRIIGPTAAGALFSLHPNAPFLVGATLAGTALLASRRVTNLRQERNP
ncbi:MAG: MFS transporter [Pseudomonadota bacterium]